MEAELARAFEIVETHLYVAMGVFARTGGILFLVPGIGERGISIRTRLGAAIAITFVLLPMISAMTPVQPSGPLALGAILVAEAICGLVLGLAFRLLVFVLQTAGMVAAHHLSVAQMLGAGVGPEPEPTIATLLGTAGIVLAILAGLHVHMVSALVSSYGIFPFGTLPDAADMGAWATRAMAETFALGVALAAPFVAIGFTYNIALGALNRAMPQLLVALVGVPFLVWVGMVILYLVLPSLFDAWTGHLDQVLVDPLGGWW